MDKRQAAEPFDCIDVKTGTENSMRFSRGNVVPLASYPHGMAAFSVQTTSKEGNWFYNPRHTSFEGLRLTHCSSCEFGDYGQLIIMPQTGRLAVSPDERWSSYIEKDFRPNKISGYLNRYRVSYELVPSTRGAFIRFKFDENFTSGRRILLLGLTGETRFVDCGGYVRGYTTAGERQTLLDEFKEYFHITLDCSYKLNCFEGGAAIEVESDTVALKIATSFISYGQALLTWHNELEKRDSDGAERDCRSVWEYYFNRVRVEAKDEVEEKRRKKFYTCLYRALLTPRCFFEVSPQHGQIHISLKDGSVKQGVLYTGGALWGASRTLFPLLSLIAPEVYRNICDGFLNMYDDSGRFPRCPMPDDMSRTPGMPVELIFCDSIVKEIMARGKRDAALRILFKESGSDNDDYRFGRVAVGGYALNGYLPYDKVSGCVTETVEYAIGDFCLKNAARSRGWPELPDRGKKSVDYKLLYNNESGCLRAVGGGGKMREPFVADEWSTDYVNSNALQTLFSPCHDIDGLNALTGGELEKRLDELLSSPSSFSVGNYGVETHFMSETALGRTGGFSFASPALYHVPYIYAALGNRDKTDRLVKEIVDNSFTEQSYPADENSGALSAWFVLACIGLYPFCPGSGEYLVTDPLFDSVELSLESGKTLTIKSGTDPKATVSHRELLEK